MKVSVNWISLMGKMMDAFRGSDTGTCPVAPSVSIQTKQYQLLCDIKAVDFKKFKTVPNPVQTVRI